MGLRVWQNVLGQRLSSRKAYLNVSNEKSTLLMKTPGVPTKRMIGRRDLTRVSWFVRALVGQTFLEFSGFRALYGVLQWPDRLSLTEGGSALNTNPKTTKSKSGTLHFRCLRHRLARHSYRSLHFLCMYSQHGFKKR